jgi:hypothetical protein
MPEQPLEGLEQLTSFHIRPLAPLTLFSNANRFLKQEFPPRRDYELCLQLANKGLSNPHFSRNQLLTLPMKTLESLARLVLEGSAQQMQTSANDRTDSTLDIILSLIMAVEDICQFDLSAMVSEDMAFLESHHSGHLHGYYFKPTQDRAILASLLQAQGYRTDFMTGPFEQTVPEMLYWLSRKLSVLLPWSAILKQLPVDQAAAFPYLFRGQKVLQFVEGTFDLATLPVDSPTFLLDELLPQVEGWVRDVFPRFSKMAHIVRPIQLLVLAEGATEELLLPAIAEAMGYNLDYEGVMVISVGGKNQMLQQYVHYAELLKVPISIVMDQDALPLFPDLKHYCRDHDQIFILEEGEFEDIYAPELIVKTVNDFYFPTQTLTLQAFGKLEGGNRVKTLQTLWQQLGIGVFDKVSFAQRLVETIRQEKLISPAMQHLIEKIMRAKPTLSPLSPMGEKARLIEPSPPLGERAG